MMVDNSVLEVVIHAKSEASGPNTLHPFSFQGALQRVVQHDTACPACLFFLEDDANWCSNLGTVISFVFLQW